VAGVTEDYHNEIGKWQRGEYDDQQIVSVTNAFLIKYDDLMDSASSISSPQKYEALELYIKSLESERASYASFRGYIETGDPRLNQTSANLLSNATEYEFESFFLINANGEAFP